MARPKKYPDELIARGIRLALESGRPIAHVAADLGSAPAAVWATLLDEGRYLARATTPARSPAPPERAALTDDESTTPARPGATTACPRTLQHASGDPANDAMTPTTATHRTHAPPAGDSTAPSRDLRTPTRRIGGSGLNADASA